LVKPAPTIARVQPLTSTRALRGPFDYRLRSDQHAVKVGSLLRIRFARRPAVGVVVELAEHSELAEDRLAEPEAVLPGRIPADLVALAEWISQEYCSTTARALGLLLPPGAGSGRAPKRVLIARLASADPGPTGATSLTERQRAALALLEREGELPASIVGTPLARRLESRGLVTLTWRTERRRPARHQIGSASATPPSLSAEQQVAVRALLEALRDPQRGGTSRFLLHGVTGSGKTEVYLRAVEATLTAGRGAIVLVPEIALTPQVLRRFEARFGEVVAVLHSGLTNAERREEWLRLAGGDARVCVGPRSAVFAPLPDIGLLIVDEEHESSYKHEGDPRYDARLVAERRAQEHRALLVLGSATPRPESMLALPRLRLSARIDRRPLPPVEVLDMRGHHHPLHPQTRMALADIRRSGRKAIVLLNRRGWSNFLSCRGCGRVWMCPNCEVALVLHRAASSVACHHCGHREAIPDRCPACASIAVARHGAGTERLEHDLLEALGADGFPVFRLDADTTASGQRAQTLERFQAAAAGLLVGTQMVAKGHDFPDVSLAVVLDADGTLRFPDFRAEERTFALVTQLAGRAGRGDAGGRVLVQTIAPHARAIRFAARHDVDGFLAGELERRRALAYPPFSSLIRIVNSAPDEASVRAVAAELHAAIQMDGATVLGPAPLFAVRGRARTQLVMKTVRRREAIRTVGVAVDGVARAAARRGVSISVDVDPQ
jgi:primosomal protein N' (replication factor Y)